MGGRSVFLLNSGEVMRSLAVVLWKRSEEKKSSVEGFILHLRLGCILSKEVGVL